MTNPNSIRFTTRTMFLVVTLLAMLFAGVGYGYRLYRSKILPVRQAVNVQRRLESLATRCPPEMSARQWDVAVQWTIALHGNSLMPFQTDAETIAKFEQALATKLSQPVDMDTIEWIWDQYAIVCPGGKSYQRFRSVMREEIDQVGKP